MGYEWATGWGIGMMIFMSVFWVLLVAGAVWLAVTLARSQGIDSGRGGPHAGTALRILEERLARGDIDVEEFRARKAAIEAGR
ncbi:MAG: SHOCT domain-containing protein [Thermoleophilaceae bacterium]